MFSRIALIGSSTLGELFKLLRPDLRGVLGDDFELPLPNGFIGSSTLGEFCKLLRPDLKGVLGDDFKVPLRNRGLFIDLGVGILDVGGLWLLWLLRAEFLRSRPLIGVSGRREKGGVSSHETFSKMWAVSSGASPSPQVGQFVRPDFVSPSQVVQKLDVSFV